MDDLPELRDIHLPQEITRFPLGYGVICFLVITALLVLFSPYLKHLYFKSKKRYALNLIKTLQHENMADVCKISEILRRVCKVKYKKAVSLYGKEWADFLQKKTFHKISKKQIDLLVNAPYAPLSSNIEKKDFEALKNFARLWVEENL
ncbi:MAG: DUF4381 domain-containing protein [Alphaproteobacteria bacterium]|nr:DUF4381 domain-containing protein [Alphaproteobacteria bacterium]